MYFTIINTAENLSFEGSIKAWSDPYGGFPNYTLQGHFTLY